jgi:hypothetical protein
MIYHHDDNHVTPVSPTASDLDPAKGVMLAVAIGFALALWLLNALAPCDGVLLCGLAAVQMRPAKQLPTVPDELLARAYPDHLPSHEYNRKELLRAIAVVRGTPRG